MLPSTSCSPYSSHPWLVDISVKKPCPVPNCPIVDLTDQHFFEYYHDCPCGLQCDFFVNYSTNPNAPFHCNIYNHRPTGYHNHHASSSEQDNTSPQHKDGRRMSGVNTSSSQSSQSSSLPNHLCWYGTKCRIAERGDVDHLSRYLHILSGDILQDFCILNALRERTALSKQPDIPGLTSKDKSKMQPHVKRWKRSASIQLTSPVEYKFIGWERQTGSNLSTGKIVIFKKTGKGVFEGHIKTEDLKNVTFPNNQIEQPWYRNRVCVYENSLVRNVFTQALSEYLDGVSPRATYLDVLKYIVNEGVPVFIVGGAVRDVLYAVLKEKETNIQNIIGKVKDIDIGFGCPPQKLFEKLSKKYTTGIQSPGPRGLVVSDIPQCFGTDLVGENICRDFTCNSLWYDLINECVIDPIGKGQGIKDALNKVLRIPVKEKYRDFWAKGNPSKIMRYYKFLQKGYKPADESTRQFIIKMANKFSDGEMECKNQLIKGVMNSKTDAAALKKKEEFLELLKKDVGSARLKELFP
ncbi:hypothetical protein FDP41_002901 [Naegleria fowleri]|uniref:Poly A polymerase head domain-containing protein n=1 Tax=Naegleria fowleri TaxID=5763 RepID=A0A6A5BT70_NAEFO|nr:uncharacterized protein FDP41_002901 [Naegleria fowleri]KAF0978386.1 hypothetical protein FDP41_002901 [Naegleria fowleri]